MQLKFSKEKKNFQKSKIHVNPDSYWMLICVVSFAAALIGCVFGFYLFNKVNKEFLLLDSEDARQRIRKERIDKALEYFSEREEVSEDILESPSPIVDPSL